MVPRLTMGGIGKERHSASCRVENDCERDGQQQASTTKNNHLALSNTFSPHNRAFLY
jgi:hypothetical protein